MLILLTTLKPAQNRIDESLRRRLIACSIVNDVDQLLD
jgi:hypothetical protein